MVDLSLLRGEVESGAAGLHRRRAARTASTLETMALALRFNYLKIAASEQAPRVCQGAMGVCGIVGFKNDTPFSVGRHLRDSMSAAVDDRERAHPSDERHRSSSSPKDVNLERACCGDRDRAGIPRRAHRQRAADPDRGCRASTGAARSSSRLRLALDRCDLSQTIDERARRADGVPAGDPAAGSWRRIGYLGSFPHLAGSIFSFDRRRRRRPPSMARARCGPCRLELVPAVRPISSSCPAACYPVLPRDGGSRRRCRTGGVSARSRRVIRLPQRALLGPGPHGRCSTSASSFASARPTSSPTGVDGGATGRSSCSRRSGSTPAPTWPRIRSSAAPAACSRAASARRPSSSRSVCRSAATSRRPSPRSTTTASTSRASSTSAARTVERCTHGVRRLRARADHARDAFAHTGSTRPSWPTEVRARLVASAEG